MKLALKSSANWCTCESHQSLVSFGLWNLYGRFVPNFKDIAAPMTKCFQNRQRKNIPALDEHESQSFDMLIRTISPKPVLALQRLDLPFVIETDVSNYQTGAALSQIYPDGNRRQVGYWSWSLNSNEKKYSIAEKECLAVVWSAQTFRPHVQGTHLTVRSDQGSLRWLLEVLEPNGQLMLWWRRFSEFGFYIWFQNGLLSTQADILSHLC